MTSGSRSYRAPPLELTIEELSLNCRYVDSAKTTQAILRHEQTRFCILRLDGRSGPHAEPGMRPAAHVLDDLVCDELLFEQGREKMLGETMLEVGGIQTELLKRAIFQHHAVGGEAVYVGVEIGPVPRRLQGHDRSGHAGV